MYERVPPSQWEYENIQVENLPTPYPDGIDWDKIKEHGKINDPNINGDELAKAFKKGSLNFEDTNLNDNTMKKVMSNADSDVVGMALESGQVSYDTQKSITADGWVGNTDSSMIKDLAKLLSESPEFASVYNSENEAKLKGEGTPAGSTSQFINEGDGIEWTLPGGFTTIDLSSFTSDDWITFYPDGYVGLSYDTSLYGSHNVRREGDFILADSIDAGTQTITTPDYTFDISFEGIDGASFSSSGYSFDTVSSLVITRNSSTGEVLTYIITDAVGVAFDGNNLVMSHADSIIVGSTILAVNSDDILMPFMYNYSLFGLFVSVEEYDEIRVNRSDLIKVGLREYENLSSSRFVIQNRTVIYANVTTNALEITYYFSNPIQTYADVAIDVSKGERFDYLNYNGSLFIQSEDVIEAVVGELYSTQTQFLTNGETVLVTTDVLNDQLIVDAVDDLLYIYNKARLVAVADECDVQSNGRDVILSFDNQTIVVPEGDYHNIILESDRINLKADGDEIIIRDLVLSIVGVYGTSDLSSFSAQIGNTKFTDADITGFAPINLTLDHDSVIMERDGNTAALVNLDNHFKKTENIAASVVIRTPSGLLAAEEAWHMSSLPDNSIVVIYEKNRLQAYPAFNVIALYSVGSAPVAIKNFSASSGELSIEFEDILSAGFDYLDLQLKGEGITITKDGTSADYLGLNKSFTLTDEIKASVIIKTPAQTLTTGQAWENAKNSTVVLPEGSLAVIYKKNAIGTPIQLSNSLGKAAVSNTEPGISHRTTSALLLTNNTPIDFDLFNGQFSLPSINKTELISSPNMSTGTYYLETGFQCFLLQSKGAYFYSDKYNSLKDFGIEAIGYFHLCLRKYPKEMFTTDCYSCGVFDFIGRTAILKSRVRYLRYPYRDNMLVSLQLKQVYYGEKEANVKFSYGSNLINITETAISSEVTDEDISIVNAERDLRDVHK